MNRKMTSSEVLDILRGWDNECRSLELYRPKKRDIQERLFVMSGKFSAIATMGIERVFHPDLNQEILSLAMRLRDKIS